jgi:hypothetical protein
MGLNLVKDLVITTLLPPEMTGNVITVVTKCQ